MDSDKEILVEFQQITQKNLSLFLEKTVQFLRGDRNSIVKYYTNQSNQIDPAVFQRFKALQIELQSCFESFQQHSRSFNNAKWWEVITVLEQIDSVFLSLINIHRWSKSSLSKFGYSSDIQINHTLTENQTLERISKDVLQQQDPNDDWYKIALSNDLSEEGYTVNGGVEIQLSNSKNRSNSQVTSVVDILAGKKINGIDLDQKITYVVDGNGFSDLALLSHEATVEQTVKILLLLKKNSNPDHPNDGLQSSVVIGGNRALLNFPVIIRQMTQTFATDDSLKNFMVKNLAFEQDNLLISYEVETRLNETYDGKQTI